MDTSPAPSRMSLRDRSPSWYFLRLGSLGLGLEWGMWLGLLVWWVDILAFSPLELALTGSLLQLTVLIMETPTGVIADLYSRKWSVVIGTGLMAAAFALSVASRTLWVVLGAQILAGFAWTFRSGAAIAWLTDELRGDELRGDRRGNERGSDHEIEQLILRRHRWSMVVSLASVGLMIMIGQSSVRLGVLALAAVQLLLAVGWSLAPERHFSPDGSHQTFMRQLRAGLASVRGRPRLMRMLMIVGLTGLGTDALDRLGFKRFIDTIDADSESVVVTGVLLLILAAGGIAVNIIVTRFVSGRESAPDAAAAPRASDPAAGSLITAAAVLFAIAGTGAIVVAIGAPLAAIGIGMLLQDATRESAYPLIESWTNRETTSDVRATVHSLTGQVYALSEMTGGLALGLLAQATNVPLGISVGAALFGAGALLTFRTRAI